MRRYTLAFFALALLLSACRIESNILLNINDDGSATVGFEVGFDEEMLDLVSQGGGDPSDILGELPDLGGEGGEPIERVEGDMTYYGAETFVDDLSTYDFEGSENETFSEFSYEFDDSTATLTAEVDATSVSDIDGEGLGLDSSQITGDIFSANVIVMMPGEVTEHNADEERSDGSLVYWLPFTGKMEIFATSTFDESGGNWTLFILGGILLVGVIATTAAVLASRKDSGKAVADAAAAHEAEEEQSAIPDQSEEADQSEGDDSSASEDRGEE